MKLSFKHRNLQLAHAWKIARTKSTDTCIAVTVELAAEDGTMGIGEASPTARYHESSDTVEAFLRKVDTGRLHFDDLADSLAYLDSLSPADMSAKCALNVALHDGAARRVNKPIHEFLGLGFREEHHVTSFSIGIDDPRVVRKKVKMATEFSVLKMKVGVPGERHNLRVLREEAPTKAVRVDANEGWSTKEQALETIEWLAADKHIQFIEQPLPASAPVKDWVWLKQRSPLPIFGDESFHLAKDAPIAAECFHGVNVKLVKAGGLDTAVEALRAARRLGLQTMLGCMIETSILISAGAHLAELCDYLDLDGNLLITNDPYAGVSARNGILSFADAPQKCGLCVVRRP